MGDQPQPAQQNSTTTNTPWSGVQPYLMNLFSSAQNAYNSAPKSAYSGPMVAPLDPLQTSAVSMAAGNAGQTNTNAGAVSNFARSELDPSFLNLNNDPYFGGAVNAAIQPLVQNFTNTVIPSIGDAAQAMGAYGGNRQGVAVANATNNLNQTIANTTAGMAQGEYNTLLGYQQNAPNLLSTSNNLGSSAAQQLLSAGSVNQNQQQSILNALLQQYQMQQTAPFTGLGQLAGALGLGTGYGTSNTQGTYLSQQPSTMSQILSGGLGLASLASLFGI